MNVSSASFLPSPSPHGSFPSKSSMKKYIYKRIVNTDGDPIPTTSTRATTASRRCTRPMSGAATVPQQRDRPRSGR